MMVSYAQNGEDVVVNRVLPRQRPGFYLDVGANDPEHYSVTKAFYDAGWRGINIEPGRVYQKLARARPGDLNLNIGLSNREGSLTFYEFPGGDDVYSTFAADEAHARARDGKVFTERTVPVLTLAAVCERHVTGPIDFLSVDVEGYELQVLEGNDWTRFRPRLVLIESTLPTTAVPSHGEWEHVLLAADYHFACFDGLNRYYVRGEDKEQFLPLLPAGANALYDQYIPCELHRQMEQLRAAGAELERQAEKHHAAYASWLREVEQHQAANAALTREVERCQTANAALTRQLEPFVGLGPNALAVARRCHRLSAKLPTLSKAFRSALRRRAAWLPTPRHSVP